MPISNNAKGSSRVDISITNNVNNNVHVGDIKTGNANYTTRQKIKMQIILMVLIIKMDIHLLIRKLNHRKESSLV